MIFLFVHGFGHAFLRGANVSAGRLVAKRNLQKVDKHLLLLGFALGIATETKPKGLVAVESLTQHRLGNAQNSVLTFLTFHVDELQG
jgi:hypothetical protein